MRGLHTSVRSVGTRGACGVRRIHGYDNLVWFLLVYIGKPRRRIRSATTTVAVHEQARTFRVSAGQHRDGKAFSSKTVHSGCN